MNDYDNNSNQASNHEGEKWNVDVKAMSVKDCIHMTKQNFQM